MRLKRGLRGAGRRGSAVPSQFNGEVIFDLSSYIYLYILYDEYIFNVDVRIRIRICNMNHMDAYSM